MDNRNTLFHKTIIVLLVAGIVVNFFRLHIQSDNLSSFMGDLKLLYVACEAFTKGENPYNRIGLQKIWQNIPDDEKIVADSKLQLGPFMYPPFVLILFQPVAFIQWNIAAYLMFGMNILLVAGIIVLIGMLGNFFHLKYEMVLFFLLLAASKLVHLSLMVGQHFFVSFFFGLLSLYFSRVERNNLAVISLSLCFVKPTIAFPFFLYFFFLKEYRICFYSFCIVLCSNLFAIPFMPLEAMQTYFQEVALSLDTGHINDYTLQNPRFFHITGIQTLLYLGLNSAIVISIVKYMIAGLMIAFSLYKKRNFKNEPYNIILFYTFFSLFFVYHQFSDTIALILVLITFKPTQLFKSLGWRIVFLIPFLFPVTGLVTMLKNLLPSLVYHVAALNIQISITMLFIFWMVMLHKNMKSRITA